MNFKAYGMKMINQKNGIALRKPIQSKKKKNKKKISNDLATLTPKSKLSALLNQLGFQTLELPSNSQKQLIYADTISAEIAIVNCNTTKKQVTLYLVKL